MSLLIRILRVLFAIAIVVICYYTIGWVLGLLGIHPPQNLMTAIFVAIGLLAAIWALTGRMDSLTG